MHAYLNYPLVHFPSRFLLYGLIRLCFNHFYHQCLRFHVRAATNHLGIILNKQFVFLGYVGPLKGPFGGTPAWTIYFDVVYLVTAFVPSLTACLANSPGRRRRTAVCTSRLLIVDFLLYWARRDASLAMRSKMSFTKLFMIDIARLETPVSG
mgnify:CR=1 FL=1